MIGTLWKSIRKRFFSSHSEHASRRHAHGRSTLLRGECLEQRQLLSANQITYQTSLSAVVVEGTSGADTVHVWTDASDMVHVSMDNSTGTQSAVFAHASVAEVRFLGGDGNDNFQNTSSVNSNVLGEGGNDVLIGGSGNDSLDGGVGNDALTGGAGNDVLSAGDGDDGLYGEDGNDVLNGAAGDDWLEGGLGTDTLYGGIGNDNIYGGDGDDAIYGDDGVDTLKGEAGNDWIDGGLGNDWVIGGVGNDTLSGGDGDDGLYGEDGADVLLGNVGNDWLEGGLASDTLYGGVGNDTLFGGDGDDGLYGEDGIDTLKGDTGNDWLDGGLGNDALSGGVGNDTLGGGDGDDGLYGEDGDDILSGAVGNDLLEGSLGIDTLYGGVGNDTLSGGDGDDRLYGDDGVDTLKGDVGNDSLDGGLGNDALYGGVGNDTLSGADGDDGLYGEDGTDVLVGSTGNDWLEGGLAIDTLYGDAGNDTLYGGDGDDILYGQDGIDTLKGDAGNDSLDGGLGNDALYGGVGNDTLSGGDGDDGLSGEDGTDVLLGYVGNDWLEGGLGNDLIYGGVGTDNLYGGDGDDGLYGEEGVDMVYGDAGNDWLDGGLGNDALSGGVGNDTLSGSDGDDGLYGEDGVDALVGGVGNDSLDGGLGNDSLYGGVGNDVLTGGNGDDNLYGEDDLDILAGNVGNDRLDGGSGNDALYGGVDNDVLIGGDGDDGLYGEDGIDILVANAGNDLLDGGLGNDAIYGGIGTDTLSGGDGDDALYGEDGIDNLTGDAGNDLLDGGIGNDALYGRTGNDTLSGGDGDDGLYGEDGTDILVGYTGNDLLDGGLGNDVMYGGAGTDTLSGSDGDDSLYGEDGIDMMNGGLGHDWIDGGIGNDALFGGAGNDWLFGFDGDDGLYGEDGFDILTGGAGNDWLDGGLGSDTVYGGTGNDNLIGQDGDDGLYGEDGIDVLKGDAGNDSLDGGAGYDALYGSVGNDTLSGGGDNDNLYGEDGNDTLKGDAGDDYLESGIGDDVLLGGAGIDQLVGGTGKDVLIGGAGKDNVAGSDGDDLLIGGSTAYDNDLEQLSAISAAWLATTPYATRIQQITDDHFTARLASVETVFDDQVSDTLTGGNNQDWFFETGYMPMYLPPDVVSPQQADIANGDILLPCGDQIMVLTNQMPTLDGFQLVDTLDTLSDRQSSETNTTVVPHAENTSLAREHLALLQLVRYDQVTSYAVRSGNWTDPSIWHGGVVPANGAKVLIPVGVTVQVDGMIPARLSTVRLDGSLSFDTTRNTQLQVDTMVVNDCGEFYMGTAAAPIARGVTARLLITDNGPIDRTWDPFGISRGLITQGTVSIYGAPVDSYESILGSALAGSQSLTMKIAPTGWKVGDSVTIAATTAGVAQNETRIIQSIAGNVVVFNQPLTYNHVPLSSDVDVQIANTTRNAVIESETTVNDRRGHVMFMHSDDVNIAYGGFYKLGRTDKSKPINDPVVQSDWTLKAGTGTNPRARYAVHFHRTGTVNDGDPAVILGSAVVDSPGWGFVNHSSYVDMTNNVAVAVNGAAFVTEVGDEIGGFYNNLAIGSTGSTDEFEARQAIQDFGYQGDGFWFQGAGVSVVGNIAAGNQGTAFVYYTRGLVTGGVAGQFLTANLLDPSIAGGAEKIAVSLVPVRAFNNNVGYASHTGLMAVYILENDTHAQSSVFENSNFWNNDVGVYLPYSQETVLRNLKVTKNATPLIGTGINGNAKTSNITYENLTVSGYVAGIELPRRGTSIVSGGTFNNYLDIVTYPALADRSILITGQATAPKIASWTDMFPVPNTSATGYFSNDTVILNFGQFVNQRLYNTLQVAGAIPFPTSRTDLPNIYVGLTNQQLWNQYGFALGGAIAPANALTVPNIIGLVAPLA
jgi:Ca2+-binding RTX toxin-like protein